MSKFVRFVFLLVGLSAALGLAVVGVSNVRTQGARTEALGAERARISDWYGKLDSATGHALFTVQRQTHEMNADARQGDVVASTTLLFGLTDANLQTPTYVQRIMIPGDKVRVEAILLSFAAAQGGEQRLLAGHAFYLFDTVAGGQGDPEPFALNQIGLPPLELRHSSPASTEFERQLWRPVWETLQSNHPGDGVKRKVIAADTKRVEVGGVYEVLVGSFGVQIVEQEGDVKWAMVRLAEAQDTETITGVKAPPATAPQP